MRCIFIIAMICSAVASNSQPYKYLALKGGGIRGIAYAGALKVLEEKNITPGIEKVAGTSAGSITGALLCLGYTAAQIEEIMYAQDLAAFNDGEGYFAGGQKRLRKKYGWYKGKRIENWIGGLIKQQTGNENTTLLQLHELAVHNCKFKDLYVTATNLTMQRPEIFSWETRPNMPIKVAVRASSAIPLYFTAVFIDSAGNAVDRPSKYGQYNVYVDGGLLLNYPIGAFKDSGSESTISKYTLGLKLERPEQIKYSESNTGIAPYDIHSLASYIAALYNLTLEQLNKNVTREQEKENTIYISTGNLNPKLRYISREQKELLFHNGELAARMFLEGKK